MVKFCPEKLVDLFLTYFQNSKFLSTNRDDKIKIPRENKIMEVFKNFLVFPIDYKSKIVFLSLEDVSKSWTFDVDWSFPQNALKPRMFLDSNKDDEEKEVPGGK